MKKFGKAELVMIEIMRSNDASNIISHNNDFTTFSSLYSLSMQLTLTG